MIFAQPSQDNCSSKVLKQNSCCLNSCLRDDSFDFLVCQIMSFVGVSYFYPIFFDDIVHPEVSIDFVICSLTSEYKYVVVKTDLHMSKSRMRGISFLRACISPAFRFFVKHHDVVEEFCSISNCSSSSKHIQLLVPSLASSVVCSWFEDVSSFGSTLNSKFFNFVESRKDLCWKLSTVDDQVHFEIGLFVQMTKIINHVVINDLRPSWMDFCWFDMNKFLFTVVIHLSLNCQSIQHSFLSKRFNST